MTPVGSVQHTTRIRYYLHLCSLSSTHARSHIKAPLSKAGLHRRLFHKRPFWWPIKGQLSALFSNSLSSGISIQKQAPCACLCFPNHSRTGNQTPAFRGKQPTPATQLSPLFHFPQLGAVEKFALPFLVLANNALKNVSAVCFVQRVGELGSSAGVGQLHYNKTNSSKAQRSVALLLQTFALLWYNAVGQCRHWGLRRQNV